MEGQEVDRGQRKNYLVAREQPSKKGKLPCGARVCVRCHKGCGVVMAAYLAGLDEEPDLKEERARN